MEKRIYKAYKKTISIVNETSVSLYENLAGKRVGFLLESYDKNYDRYTLIGADPEEVITSSGNALVIQKRDGTKEIRRGNPLLLLKAYYDEFEIRKDDSGPDFSGGLVGSIGYDFIRCSEDLPEQNADEIGIETVQMMWMKEFLVVDHMAETLTATILDEDSEAGKNRAAQLANHLIQRAMNPKNSRVSDDGKTLVRDGKILRKSDTPDAYCQKVEKIRQYIRDGHIFQAVLSQR